MKRVGHPAMQSQFTKWLGASDKRYVDIRWNGKKFRCQIYEVVDYEVMDGHAVTMASESFASTPDGAYAGAVINGKFD